MRKFDAKNDNCVICANKIMLKKFKNAKEFLAKKSRGDLYFKAIYILNLRKNFHKISNYKSHENNYKSARKSCGFLAMMQLNLTKNHLNKI